MAEPSTDVGTVQTSPSVALVSTQIQDVETLARGLVRSGQFKGVPNVTVAMARIMLGADLGMSPTQALLGIDLVKGNPQIRGVALGRMVRERANYDYDVLTRSFTPGEEGAIVAIYRRDPDTGEWPTANRDRVFQTSMGDVTVFAGDRLPKGVEAFKLDQAKRRGLVKDDGAWGTQPEVMVVWRALSQAVRFHAPDVIGGMPVYTEADSFGPIIDAGTGDGEPPEWLWADDVTQETRENVAFVMARAERLGHAGLSDPSAVRMRINGQPADVVKRWVADSLATLDEMQHGQPERGEPEPIADADVVPLTLTFGGETFEFADEGDPYAAIVAALGTTPEFMESAARDLLGMADSMEHHEPDDAKWYRDMAAALHAEAGVKPADDGIEF